jgi:hypothetical protein
LEQGGRELGAELTSEVRSSDARVHAGEGERATGCFRGQLDPELAKAAGGFWAELEFPFAVSGLKRSRLDEVVHQSDADLPGEVVIAGRGHERRSICSWRGST